MINMRRGITAACLLGLAIALSPARLLADDQTRTGVISEISADGSGMMIEGSFYRIDDRTVVHAPMGKGFVSRDALVNGTHVGFRTSPLDGNNAIPKIAEIWIYLD